MKINKVLCFLSVHVLLVLNLSAQRFPFDDQSIEKRIRKDVAVLASDSFKGREAGTEGEKLAYDYLVNQFQDLGLVSALPNKSFLQPFEFVDGLEIGNGNELTINQKVFKLGKDYFPLSYSTNSTVEADLIKVGFGIHSSKLNYNDYKSDIDYKGKIFVIETSIPEGYNPTSKYIDFTDLQIKIDTAIAHGAKAIIFINSEINYTKPSEKLSNKIPQCSIPVIFADQLAYKLIMDGTFCHAKVTVNLKKIKKTGYNVIGFLDKGAKTNVVIGAHYDHLGMGGEYARDIGVVAVHNGADDNASGTAALLELARYLTYAGPMKNNLLFIAFSAEEKGTYGSSYFAKSNDFDMSKINYMLNFDMVGHLDSARKGLIINGSGSSPVWDTLITNSSKKIPIKNKKVESALGGSDQLAFYLKGIPVLFFCTDVVDDYHKATDDAEKLNYTGEVSIIKYAESLIEGADKYGKLNFTKTKDSIQGKTMPKGPTLGVVPDHTFDGKGMRIDAVIDGRPAAKAGMKAGDIVIKIGEFEVVDVATYMKALSHFKKSDKTTIVFRRVNEEMKTEVEL